MNALPASVFGQLDVLMESHARSTPREVAVPVTVLTHLQRHGVDEAFLERLFGQWTNIVQLEQRGANLSPEHSDRAIRVLRIVSLSERVFGDTAKALMWLQRSNKILGGDRPFDLLVSETGARFVEEALLRIEYGIAA